MKTYLLAATALSILAFSNGVFAAEDARELSVKERTIQEDRAYNYEYNRDEQCQNYDSGVKSLGYRESCRGDDEVEVTAAPVSEVIEVLKEYVVYFDFDKSDIRPADMTILQNAAKDIETLNPGQVLVAGYTDTRGTNDYNDVLSAKRASAVSGELKTLGVMNSVVDEKALGETNLAVETADSVEKQENRRVVIQFVK